MQRICLIATQQSCVLRWMITSGTMQNKSGDREMLFSPDLPEDLMQRYCCPITFCAVMYLSCATCCMSAIISVSAETGSDWLSQCICPCLVQILQCCPFFSELLVYALLTLPLGLYFLLEARCCESCRYFDKLHSKQTSVPVSFNELQAFLPQVASAKDAAKNIGFPIAVMIAGDDSLIMRHQVQATADYFGVKPVVLPGLAHDVMLVCSLHSCAYNDLP